jgi:alanine dehydrogenase
MVDLKQVLKTNNTLVLVLKLQIVLLIFSMMQEIIVKVKEPQKVEVNMIRENQIVYTYLHLAAAKELT